MSHTKSPTDQLSSDVSGDGNLHIGRSTTRVEDIRLVTGGGTYLADLPRDGALEVSFVRSSYAHAKILAISVEAARTAPGVFAVLTAADLGEEMGPMPVIWQQPGLRIPDYFALARDRVHYVGQPIVAVLAASRALAEDAQELVSIDYEELPVVVNAIEALETGSALVHPEFGTNEAFQLRTVSADVDAQFEAADVVVDAEIEMQRQTALPMEGRGILVRPSRETSGITVWATVQHPHLFRQHLAELLEMPIGEVRVIVPDLGGAFGAYYEVYPEDIVVAWAAHRLGVAVRWLEDRQESFLSTVHARQQHHRIALALTKNGKILALRDQIVTDLGAYCDYSGVGPSYLSASYMTGVYDIGAADVELKCVFTNKVRSGAYRGFGQPEATFVLERAIDIAAARLGIDPVELRSRNLIQPEQFPYTIASKAVMDSGDFPGLLDKAVTAIGYGQIRAEQKKRAGRGADGQRKLGVGIAMYAEFTGSSPSKSLGQRGYQAPGWECVSIEVDHDGRVRAVSGVSHYGQGARTAIAQIAADRLGLAPHQIEVVTGDTARVPYGNRGSVGSRSAVIAGEAMNRAATGLAERIRVTAASLLEAEPADLLLKDGRVQVKGSPSAGMSFAELSRQVYTSHHAALEGDPTLEFTAFYDPAGTPFGSGVHAAVIEVDTETGDIDILRYVVVHDCGNVINPAIVEGQVLGGTAQGLGGAILEELVYDESAQLRSCSMMDYLTPSAMEVPLIEIVHQVTPSPLNPLGLKGAGEAGTVGPAAVLANAVSDALGVQVTQLPLSPSRVWQLGQNDRQLLAEVATR